MLLIIGIILITIGAILVASWKFSVPHGQYGERFDMKPGDAIVFPDFKLKFDSDVKPSSQEIEEFNKKYGHLDGPLLSNKYEFLVIPTESGTQIVVNLAESPVSWTSFNVDGNEFTLANYDGGFVIIQGDIKAEREWEKEWGKGKR